MTYQLTNRDTNTLAYHRFRFHLFAAIESRKKINVYNFTSNFFPHFFGTYQKTEQRALSAKNMTGILKEKLKQFVLKPGADLKKQMTAHFFFSLLKWYRNNYYKMRVILLYLLYVTAVRSDETTKSWENDSKPRKIPQIDSDSR